MSPAAGLLLADPTSDPSKLWNLIFEARLELPHLTMTERAFIERRCRDLESEVHKLYTPFEFFAAAANGKRSRFSR